MRELSDFSLLRGFFRIIIQKFDKINRGINELYKYKRKLAWGAPSVVFSNSNCFSCDVPFVNVNFEAKACKLKKFASGRGVRELSDSNRCLKNRVVRDLSECVT